MKIIFSLIFLVWIAALSNSNGEATEMTTDATTTSTISTTTTTTTTICKDTLSSLDCIIVLQFGLCSQFGHDCRKSCGQCIIQETTTTTTTTDATSTTSTSTIPTTTTTTTRTTTPSTTTITTNENTTTFPTSTLTTTICKDNFSSSDCMIVIQFGLCSQFGPDCRKSCGQCIVQETTTTTASTTSKTTTTTTTTTTETTTASTSGCFDDWGYDFCLMMRGFCFVDQVKQGCKKTCGVCRCEDENPTYCHWMWWFFGCQPWNKGSCKKTCGLC